MIDMTPIERQALGRRIEPQQELHDVIQGLRWVEENTQWGRAEPRKFAPILQEAAERLARMAER